MDLKFFKFKKKRKQVEFIEKPYKYAPTNLTKATYVSKAKNILITGLESSGKSKELLKLWENKSLMYPRHSKSFIYINCNDGLTDWIEYNYNEWAENGGDKKVNSLFNRSKEITKDDMSGLIKLHNKVKNKGRLTMWTKTSYLIEECEGAIIFIDDINKANGKKLEALKDILRKSKRWVITSRKKHLINKNLLNIIGKNNQELALSTNIAVDGTDYIFVIFIAVLAIIGHHELAMLITIGGVMMRNSKKSKS